LTAARIVILALAVAGALIRPFRMPAFMAPIVCAVVAVSSGLVSLQSASHSLRPLMAPLGFLLAAIPLAVLLDRFGYFEQVAARFGSGRLLVPGLWLLGAGTVAVLNLDAAVVLLTPLYVRIARHQGRSARYLGFQPVLLALLASSFLPVSNLTNLIAVARYKLVPWQFLEHLALTGLAACSLGFFLYRLVGKDTAFQAFDEPRGPIVSESRRDTRVLATGSVLVVLVLAGFLAGPSRGVAEWEVALGADVVLCLLTRRLPWRTIPWRTALLAAGLGVLAAAATVDLHLGGLLSGDGTLAYLREAALSGAGANVVNNLPALLVSLPALSNGVGHASCSVWPVLWGVNSGPGLLVTGSLASLLWVDAMGRLGEPVGAGGFLKVGVRVVLPSAIVGLAVLVALAPAVGC
jgi:arsenical pump membrane protein